MKILIALILLAGLAGCSKKDDCCSSAPTAGVEKFKDPVCGMWVAKDEKARLIGTATWDNAEWFFCAADCRKVFLENPTKYATACNCRRTTRDCQCDHCVGKQVPCDCK